MVDPIYNSGVPPIQPTPGHDRDKPMVGAGEEAQQRPFSLPPSPSSTNPQGVEAQKPSPMEVAKDAGQAHTQWTPEEMSAQLKKLQQTYDSASAQLQKSGQKLNDDHYKALAKLTGELSPHMDTISKTTLEKPFPSAAASYFQSKGMSAADAEAAAAQMTSTLKMAAAGNAPATGMAGQAKGAGESSGLTQVLSWLGASQDVLGKSLQFLQTDPTLSIGSYLKLQYSVQRATQRGELFASIIGSSVSGIKTILSTQLG